MANMNTTKNVLSVVATSSSKIRELVIQNGQLIFIQDLCRIAFDYNNKRVFYNQITELETESQRLDLDSPLEGYYFVIDTAVLWYYKNGWTQITSNPDADSVIFVGVELPALGHAKENVLYIDKAQKEIAIYDVDSNAYVVVADKTQSITADDVISLFN